MAKTPPRKIAAKKKEVTSPLSSLSIYGKQEMQRIAREDSDKRIAKEVLRSPAADTLWELSGGGKPIRSNTYANLVGGAAKVGALYNPALDAVGINPDEIRNNDNNEETQNTALRFLSHEAGHRADFRRPYDAPGKNAPFKAPSGFCPAFRCHAGEFIDPPFFFLAIAIKQHKQLKKAK